MISKKTEYRVDCDRCDAYDTVEIEGDGQPPELKDFEGYESVTEKYGGTARRSSHTFVTIVGWIY